MDEEYPEKAEATQDTNKELTKDERPMHSCDIGIHICGLDLIATIEYQVTFRGYSGSVII
jgi:hypothetical protein